MHKTLIFNELHYTTALTVMSSSLIIALALYKVYAKFAGSKRSRCTYGATAVYLYNKTNPIPAIKAGGVAGSLIYWK